MQNESVPHRTPKLSSEMERCSAMRNLGGDLRCTAWFGSSAHGLISGAPVRVNRVLTGGNVTVCKYVRRRKPPGKSVEQKRKEFEARKVELLKKSRGTESRIKLEQNEEVLGPLVVANECGGLSVSALQPIEDYPVGDLRAESFLQNAAQSSWEDNNAVSLNEGVVPQVRKNGARMSIVEHTIIPRVQEKQAAVGTPPLELEQASVEHFVSPRIVQRQIDHIVTSREEQEQQSARSVAVLEKLNPDTDDEEWVEVGIDEPEDGDVEEVDFWAGDLPSMTPEQEAELLREAELELAELEKLGEPGRVADLEDFTPETRLNSERVEIERKLADLKLLVQQMEEKLTGDDGKAVESAPAQNARTTAHRKLDSVEMLSEGGIDDEAEWDEEDEEEFDEENEEEEQRIESEEIRLESKRIQLQHTRPRLDYWEEEFDDEFDVKEERGIPAVMRCFDRAKIYVKSGDGGNGVVAFRREKFVPFGGPFGGTGGRGGHVYVEAHSSMNSLLPFRRSVHFRAGRGSHGGGKKKEGAVGVDCTVKVPPGTLIKEPGPDGKVLLELSKAGQREMLLPGGAGGRGNAAFKTGRNNAPQLAEFGETGAEMWIELELKLVADVGIVGVPNAGKSTLLSAISAAKPEIANYPFTTLLPNLGVVALDYEDAMVVADLPGLLEGAHTGKGLGHEFLRHTERCKVLVHVVDGMSLQPLEEFEAVRLELELFNPKLSEKPFVVAFNKMDIPEAAERWEAFQQSIRSKGIEPFCMSAATTEGTSEIIRTAHELLKTQKESAMNDQTEEDTKTIAVAEIVAKQKGAPIEHFTINADKHTRTWQVVGAGLERFTQMTNWEYFEAVRRFQNVLSASGVNKALKEDGVQEGDTVIVGEMEFSWIDSENMSALKDWKRGNRGSRLWPH